MRIPPLPLLLLIVAVSFGMPPLPGPSTARAETTLTKTDTGYDVSFNGELFASYRTNFEGTPIIWPLVGPTGHHMTRDFPMVPKEKVAKSEMIDHPHHRSLWFTHGEVEDKDGVMANFWHGGKDVIKHDDFQKAECDGKTATLITMNTWIRNDKDDSRTPLAFDRRRMKFGQTRLGDATARFIDFCITVTAIEKITFGDTKEGTFGIRVPGTVDVDAKKRDPAWGGTILDSEGNRDGNAWAKRAAWVDYSGPVEDETHGKAVAGITVMNHPSSFRYPTYWHVRTYGLFAANPFGEHDFENKKEKTGRLELKPDESFTLHYRILLHEGPADAKALDAAFKEYETVSCGGP